MGLPGKCLLAAAALLLARSMSKPVRVYQDELGLALARELQRNQERSRRGRTPLQPSLSNSETNTKSYADQTAYNNATAYSNQAQNNAQSYASSQDQSILSQAQSYANQQDAIRMPANVEVMWNTAAYGSPPAGWYDTGRTVALDGANQRHVIRKS